VQVPPGKLVQTAGEAADVKPFAAKGKAAVDGKFIPDPLLGAWKSIEFGASAAAVSVVKENKTAKDASVKTVANGLDNMIRNDVLKQLSTAQTRAVSRKWDAYRIYASIAANFTLYPEAKRAQTEADKLKNDAAVKNELAAKPLLDTLLGHFDARDPAKLKEAKDALAELNAKYAATECAKAAKNVKIRE
jgi:hypothetical protein